MEDILLENQVLKEQLQNLRRDQNKLVIENSFIRKENENNARQLKGKQKYEKSLRDEIRKLLQKLDSSDQEHRSFDLDDARNSVISVSTESTQFLSEQLDSYRENFYAEKKERQKLQEQNGELQVQLEQIKIQLEQQQKKLVMYSNCFRNPICSEMTLRYCKNDKKRPSKLSYNQDSVTHSEILDNMKPSLMTSYHKSKSNEHLLENSLIQTHRKEITERPKSGSRNLCGKELESVRHSNTSGKRRSSQIETLNSSSS